jgi:diguanylate cyclase
VGDACHALIVNSIIELGHHLGLTVVAEGVETHDVLVALTVAGCDVAQGFYLCRPVPVDQLDRWRASGGVPTGM